MPSVGRREHLCPNQSPLNVTEEHELYFYLILVTLVEWRMVIGINIKYVSNRHKYKFN